MTENEIEKHVFYVDQTKTIQDRVCEPGYYFWDEAGLLGYGPYQTKEECIFSLNSYANWLYHNIDKCETKTIPLWPQGGLLAGKKVYLSSPIEAIVQENNVWHSTRNIIKEELRERFGLLVHDPYDDEENCEDHFKEVAAAKEAGDYDKLNEIFRRIVRIDLRLVDRADIIVAYVPKNVKSVGVPHEIIVGNNLKKPVFLVEGGSKKDISLWYYGFIPHEHMFNEWTELFSYLKRINNGDKEVVADNRISSMLIKNPKGWD